MASFSLIMAPVGVIVQQAPPSAEAVELLAAIDSLYRDGMKPYGRILRKRLAERARASRRPSGDLSLQSLKATCEACPWVLVHPEEGGTWSAALHGRPADFVDVHSTEDVYPEDLWQEFAEYFERMRDDDTLPGGRYACARVLVSRQLPCLQGRSFGQICHIVQLAITERKILGYLDGMLVPYRRSISKAKEECAREQLPFADKSEGGHPTATMELLRGGLRELLYESGTGEHTISLSDIKRLFSLRFSVHLSETALGYAKLSELFNDPQLSDLCKVRLGEQGYVLVPSRLPESTTIRLAEHLTCAPASSCSCSTSAPRILGSDKQSAVEAMSSGELTPQRTTRSTGTAGTGAPGSTASFFEGSSRDESSDWAGSTVEVEVCPSATSPRSSSWGMWPDLPGFLSPQKLSELGYKVQNTFIDGPGCACALPTRRRSRSL